MATERKERPVQFDELLAHATDYFDEVAAGKSVTVERDGQLIRLSPARRRVIRSGWRFSIDDPLLAIAGIGSSGESKRESNNDVARNKHTYLADAAADLHALCAVARASQRGD